MGRETKSQRRPDVMDFKDCRSRKVVLVAHCHLNQNSRHWKCAECPAATCDLIGGLLERDIGILQMPCPELLVLGLDRRHFWIRSGLESIPARQAILEIAKPVVFQIEQYQSCGVKVLGALGNNGSPCCGVEETSKSDGKGSVPGEGVFIEILRREMRAAGCEVPVVGIKDKEQAAALAVVDGWLQ